MSYVEWMDHLHAVGIENIDSEHRALIRLANEFIESVQDNDPDHVFARVVELIRHVMFHFREEERLLVKGGLPEERLRQHVSDHDQASHYALDCLREFHNGGNRIKQIEIAEYLLNWLVEHIAVRDREDVLLVHAMAKARSTGRG